MVPSGASAPGMKVMASSETIAVLSLMMILRADHAADPRYLHTALAPLTGAAGVAQVIIPVGNQRQLAGGLHPAQIADPQHTLSCRCAEMMARSSSSRAAIFTAGVSAMCLVVSVFSLQSARRARLALHLAHDG